MIIIVKAEKKIFYRDLNSIITNLYEGNIVTMNVGSRIDHSFEFILTKEIHQQI